MKAATWIRIAGLIVLVLALEAVCRFGLVRPKLIVAPSEMVRSLIALMGKEAFWRQVGASGWAVLVSFVSAVFVGCAAAVVLHALPRVRAALDPFISSYYALPVFVLYPLLVVLMGTNRWPIITIGFLYGVVSIVVGTLNGLDRIPQVLSRTGYVFQLSRFGQAWHILIPAAAPYVFTGAKLALGYAITGVLGSEFILSDRGFGYDLSYAYNNFDDRRMYGLLLFLILVVSGLTALMFAAERAVNYRAGSARRVSESPPPSTLERFVSTLSVLACMAAGWQLLYLKTGMEVLASPAMTVDQLVALLGSASFWSHFAETARALAYAVLISCVVGAIVGILVGASPLATDTLSPVLLTLYSLPKVALYPLVLLFVGTGFAAKVLFGAMHGLIPMMLIAINAVRSMNATWLRAGHAMGLRQTQMLGTIVLPAIVPELVSGLRVSFSISLLGVMVGEMFASSRGLGFLIMNSINVNDVSTMMAVTMLVGAIALVANAGFLAAERVIGHRSNHLPRAARPAPNRSRIE